MVNSYIVFYFFMNFVHLENSGSLSKCYYMHGHSKDWSSTEVATAVSTAAANGEGGSEDDGS